MKKSLLLLLILTICACKADTKEEVKDQIVEEKPINEFIVQLNFKSNIDDEFTLSLYNIVVDEFQTKSIKISEKVIKTTSLDKVVANFGQNFSTGFSLNLGRKHVKEVEIKSIDFTYGKNYLSIPPKDFEIYFRFNNYVLLDTLKNTLKTQKVNGKHIPILYLKRNAINILKKDIK